MSRVIVVLLLTFLCLQTTNAIALPGPCQEIGVEGSVAINSDDITLLGHANGAGQVGPLSLDDMSEANLSNNSPYPTQCYRRLTIRQMTSADRSDFDETDPLFSMPPWGSYPLNALAVNRGLQVGCIVLSKDGLFQESIVSWQAVTRCD